MGTFSDQIMLQTELERLNHLKKQDEIRLIGNDNKGEFYFWIKNIFIYNFQGSYEQKYGSYPFTINLGLKEGSYSLLPFSQISNFVKHLLLLQRDHPLLIVSETSLKKFIEQSQSLNQDQIQQLNQLRSGFTLYDYEENIENQENCKEKSLKAVAFSLIKNEDPSCDEKCFTNECYSWLHRANQFFNLSQLEIDWNYYFSHFDIIISTAFFDLLKFDPVINQAILKSSIKEIILTCSVERILEYIALPFQTFLSNNFHLDKISLKGNGILQTPSFNKALIEGLKANYSLTRVELRSFILSGDEIDELIKVLKFNNRLRLEEFLLVTCEISSSSVEKLLEYSKAENSNIKKLNLLCCYHFDDNRVKCLHSSTDQ